MTDHPTPTKEQQEAAYKLVGEFMFHWAFIESRITQGLQKLLRLPTPQGEIVLANLAFRDKTSMLATLASYILDREKTKAASKAALKLVDALVNFNSKYRNVLAHNAFVPLAKKEGAIEILRVKAKGKFEMPETIWDHDFFEDRFKEIDQLEILLETLFATLVAGATVEDATRALFNPIFLSTPHLR
jgi:hypothetical protein